MPHDAIRLLRDASEIFLTTQIPLMARLLSLLAVLLACTFNYAISITAKGRRALQIKKWPDDPRDIPRRPLARELERGASARKASLLRERKRAIVTITSLSGESATRSRRPRVNGIR